MSAHYPPLPYADVIAVLRSLGFNRRPSKGGSHEQWVREDSRGFCKVTVDRPKAPFSGDLVRWMARQAGMSKREFYTAWRKL
jgi:predicted RNA binding protein YcfA (HicA-like mRNA interferase family)